LNPYFHSLPDQGEKHVIHIVRDRYLRGTSIEQMLLVKRRSLLWLRTGIAFIHVPKAAGTSISHALYGRFTGHVRAVDVLRWGSSAVNSLPRVAVVRNPWDRLVSAYRFIKRGGGVGGPDAGGVWRPEQYQIPEFETFERFVNDWLAPRNPRTLDFVFQPQSDFFCDKRGQVAVDHLGRFEDIENTHAYLREKVPTLPPLRRSNRSGEPVDYRTFYTPELADRIRKIYTEDIELLGYNFDGFGSAGEEGHQLFKFTSSKRHQEIRS
jgi:chondroitin 4-sulfotransferase 11